jgi:hypothetical protein
MVSTSTLTAIDLLDKVNAFYSSAWDQLMAVVGVSFAITGILVPLLYEVYRKRNEKATQSAMRQKFEDEAKSIKEALKSELIASVKQSIDSDLKERDRKIFRAIRISESRVFHVQGNALIDQKRYPEALASFLTALKTQANNNDCHNLKKLLTSVPEFVLPNIKANQITADIESRFSDALEAIQEKNVNLEFLLSDEIKKLEEEFEKAKNRKS